MKYHRFTLGLILLIGLALTGCRHAVSAYRPIPSAAASTLPVSVQAPLTLDQSRAQLAANIIDDIFHRILRHRHAARDLSRIVNEDAPLVAQAAQQPQVSDALQRIARESGFSVDEARQRWERLQEADLLLESSGDPEAVSVSHAVGVAQWMDGTARSHGLPVDTAASNRLTALIDHLKWKIAWCEYLCKPGCDLKAAGGPALTPAEATAQLPGLRGALASLQQKRRQVDTRYDPRQAIFAQTRYLLALYARFPNFAWLFQAYHGGEAGVQRTLRKYLEGRWPGSAAAAIQAGENGRPLPYEDIYFTAKPGSHGDAFAYLYGRSDDHRHYWWKLLASEQVIDLYRRDPAAFQAQWIASLPGRAVDAAWYPDAPKLALTDTAALQAAVSRHLLVAVPPTPGLTIRQAPGDPLDAARKGLSLDPHGACAVLRPEARGALLLLAAAYRRAGGPGQLQVGDMTHSQDYAAHKERLYPRPPHKGPLWPPDPDEAALPGGGPPPGFDFHTTGLAFDILRPTEARQREILEYALGYLADRKVMAWIEARDYGGRRYHVVPNPRYAAALARIASSERVPPTLGL
ncbi:MAG TPA: hypothetical protein VFA07_17900 [Chthonomonadaceae bacterium]|nr:hypothetical protein [Chthonomonadaceae bacterium]